MLMRHKAILFSCVSAIALFLLLSAADEKKTARRFELVDPETAPESIRPLVMQGYQLMMQTHKYAPDYAEDWISCTNCHFAGGNTFGDINDGISLVGVTTRYPRHMSGEPEYTLADRINACFEKSMNGRPLPKDSSQMKALLAYLEWISVDAEHMEKIPWLGLKKLRSQHTPDPKNGKTIYEINCAMCHGSHGEGQRRELDLSYPPLWGEHAYNDDAGMNKLSIFASFIYHNMPYQDPQLSIEEALDVAAFVKSQPHPKRKSEAKGN